MTTAQSWQCDASPTGRHKARESTSTTFAKEHRLGLHETCLYCAKAIHRPQRRSAVWRTREQPSPTDAQIATAKAQSSTNAETDHPKLESRTDLRSTETQREQEGLAGDTIGSLDNPNPTSSSGSGAPSSHVDGDNDFIIGTMPGEPL
jgi:hypothetical protein